MVAAKRSQPSLPGIRQFAPPVSGEAAPLHGSGLDEFADDCLFDPPLSRPSSSRFSLNRLSNQPNARPPNSARYEWSALIPLRAATTKRGGMQSLSSWGVFTVSRQGNISNGGSVAAGLKYVPQGTLSATGLSSSKSLCLLRFLAQVIRTQGHLSV